MRIAINAEDHAGYTRFLAVQEIDAETLCAVDEKFRLYKLRGAILDGRFEDTQWVL